MVVVIKICLCGECVNLNHHCFVDMIWLKMNIIHHKGASSKSLGSPCSIKLVSNGQLTPTLIFCSSETVNKSIKDGWLHPIDVNKLVFESCIITHHCFVNLRSFILIHFESRVGKVFDDILVFHEHRVKLSRQDQLTRISCTELSIESKVGSDLAELFQL